MFNPGLGLCAASGPLYQIPLWIFDCVINLQAMKNKAQGENFFCLELTSGASLR